MAAGNLRVRVSTTNVKPQYRDGVVLMAFHKEVPITQQNLIISSVGAREIKQIGVGVHVLDVGRGRVLKAIRALKAHREVRYAEPDYLQTAAAASSPNDPNLALQWAIQNTGQTVNGVTGTAGADQRAKAAWGVTTGTNSVVVVILDTGVQYSHPDLAVNMWNNPGGVGGCPAGTHGYNVVSSNCDPMDLDTAYNGHGSHIAGIIGAVTNNAAGVAGVNWTASIMALKWLTSNSSGNTSDLITAMDWVIQAKQAGVNVRVANDSVTFVGTAFSQALSDEIDLFGTNDILFVTAAGNTAQNNDTTPRYPCSYDRPNMICVAASDQNDNIWSSSNYGPTSVDLAAPGVNIYSTLRLSNYGYISGTSMSAAEVSGTAALVLSRGNQTTSNLKSDILNNVDTLSSLNGFVGTSGRLNVCKAVPGCSSAVTGSPVNVGLPVVTALAQFGSLVGASTGMWSGIPTNYTYQWYRCDSSGLNCLPIVGANSQTYGVLADADTGATLRVTVTASNASGSSSAQSSSSSVVTQAPSPFGISSTIQDGDVIGGSLQWQASPTPTVNFVQFFVDGVLSQTDSTSPYLYNAGTTGVLDTTTMSNGTHVLGIRALSSDNRTYGFYGATVVVSNSFSITTTSLPNGTQNTAYSATLAASGGTTPYSWSISSGSLPAGLTLNSSTGAITGTPTGTGTSNFTVQVTDANSQTATKALSITISSGGGGGGVISVLQARNANQSGVTSLTVNMATTAGSTIICGVSEGDNATNTWTMTDSAGQLGWTQDASGYLTADTTQRADMRYITNSAALSFVRANFSTRINAPATMVCYEVSGIVSVSAEDSSVNTTSRGGGLVSGPLTTSNANDILIYLERKGANQTSWTAGSGYVFAANAFNARMAIQYKIVSASQTNTMTSMTPNPDSGSSSIGIFAAFKSSGSPPSPTITTASLTNGTQNTAYSATLAASGGTTPYTWSISAGSLPAGLTLNSSTGAITGTPTGTGTSNFTVQVTDANSQTATKALSITVNPPALTITTTSLTNGTQNTAYSATLAASGGTTPYTWSITAGSLPAGLTLNSSTGAISGTPTGTGTSNFTVQVTDANSQTAAKALSITVNPPALTITTTSLTNGTQNTAYSATLAASGGTTPYTWSITAGSLPAGLTLNSSTGAISGTPTGTGTSNFTVQVTDANSQTAAKALSITVNPPALTITTTSLTNGTQNTAYSATLAASGGTTPYTWSISAGSLPAGLTLNSATGAITGTPTGAGTSNFTVQVTDANSQTATKALSITVNPPALTITTTSLTNGTQNTAYSATLAASGGTTPYTWSISAGSLPAGLTLNSATGAITGTPTGTGTSNFTVQVTDANSQTATKALSITVNPPALTITTSSLTNGTQNTAYSATLAASGGTTPYTWSITAGSLPAGLTLNSSTGAISGTPTGTGTSNFTVQVTDANSQTAAKALSITVNPPALTISTTSLTNGTQNTAYSATLAASGGTTPYTWSISAGSLPAGLTLNSATGAITGTPTGTGTSNFTVQVTDANSQTATQALSITINSAGGGISVLQAQNANLTGVSSITVNITTQAGSAIICGVREGDNNTDTWTMTDSAGQTGWSQVASGYVSPNTTNRADMRYITNSVALTWVRANFSSPVSNPATMVCYEVSGIVTISAEDASINSTSSGGGLVSRPLTTSNANDILIYMEGKGANQTSWAAGPGYLFPVNAANARVAIQYKIVSTTQANTTTSMTPSPDTGSSASVFAAFK